VHATPHRTIDVAALNCDALACSAYKWFGPHVGVLYGKADILERLPAYKVRPAHDRFETGTPNYEGIAGTLAATDYLRDVGRTYGDVTGAPGAGDASERRRELVAGMVAIADYERALVTRFIDGLETIKGVTLYGAARDRTPTVMFTVDGLSSNAVATALAAEGVAVWDGDYYAFELSHHLGLQEHGAVRAGCVAYNDTGDVDRLLSAVAALRPAATAEATR
jgi:selenocysteine lyase/cysteine desulfurase